MRDIRPLPVEQGEQIRTSGFAFASMSPDVGGFVIVPPQAQRMVA
jgi:hypothetical protein